MALIALISPYLTARLTYDKQYMDIVTEQHLNSFGISLELTPKKKIDFKSLVEYIIYPLKNPIQVKTISDHAARQAAFKAFQPPEQQAPLSPCIDLPLCLKIGLFCGTEYKSRNKHLAHYLSTSANSPCIQTESGKAFLVHTLSQPHTDINIIKQKQRIISSYVANATLFNKTTGLLTILQKHESYVLSYYNSNTSEIHCLMTQYHDAYYWKTIPFLNTNALGLRIGLTIGPISQIILSSIVAYNMSQLINNTDKKNSVKKHPLHIVTTILKNTVPVLAYAAFSKLRLKDIPHLLQEHLIGVTRYLQTVKQLYHLLSQDTALSNHFAPLKILTMQPTDCSSEFKELLQLLNSHTFAGDPSFFSYTGNVLRAHLLLNTESVQKELAHIINMIGELDACVGLAHKINANKDKQVCYCLASFDTTSTAPYIKATDLWNPFIDESSVTTNTIELGGDQPRCMILSGPNTGGKSTLSKGILLNTILAQTFGIAAARSFTLTPFGNLDCFMNMADDTASGVSGLQAEINRAKNIISKLKSTGPSRFHFMLLDEFFTTISPDQTERLAVRFISLLSQNPYCILIAATHFDGVIDFAKQTPHCKNCHMEVETDTKGRISKYTYKLAEGRSMIKNSLQVAQEAGLDIF